MCSKQESDQDQDSYLLAQDWSRTRKNLSPNTSAARQKWDRIRVAGVDSDRILRFFFGSGPGVKNL